jgi:hypothetical protein
VDESPSTEQHRLLSLREIFASLEAAQRLAVIGALVAACSLFLPWYGIRLQGDLVKTGFGAFSPVEGAFLLTLAGAVFLIYEIGRGRHLPAPLREGTLLAAAAVWSALLVVYRAFDRPNLKIGDVDRQLDVRYGILIALIGCGILFVAGLRRRQHEREAD